METRSVGFGVLIGGERERSGIRNWEREKRECFKGIEKEKLKEMAVVFKWAKSTAVPEVWYIVQPGPC